MKNKGNKKKVIKCMKYYHCIDASTYAWAEVDKNRFLLAGFHEEVVYMCRKTTSVHIYYTIISISHALDMNGIA